MPKKRNPKEIKPDFQLFTTMWNLGQGRETPALHMRMADWLEERWNEKDTRLLLMAFRAAGKSSIAGLFCAWLLYRDPNLRILVLAADSILARKMVRQVKRIIERHALTYDRLKPHNPDQWAGSRFTVNRTLELRDPSMLARGMDSNITGSRADIVICDDVEVPNTCDTATKRADLRAKLAEIDYVLSPGGMQMYIGTPHTYYTIYADSPRREINEDREFLRGFSRLEIPVLDANGASAWPEKFPPAALEDMKLRTGPNKFSSQMMLRPVNIAEGRLDPDLLQIYDDELDYTKELQTLFLGRKKLVGASAWWDPAFASARGDSSVLAAVFADGEGNYYLHRVAYLKNTGQGDEATAQCLQVATIARDLYLPSVTVETNGIGKFLPSILRNEIAKAKAPCAVKEFSNTRPKDLRILEAFDAVLAARRLYVHRSVCDTRFLMEMREWRPGGKGRDDALDAVAGALAQQPVRLPRLYAKGGHTWTKGAKSHRAGTEFEV